MFGGCYFSTPQFIIETSGKLKFCMSESQQVSFKITLGSSDMKILGSGMRFIIEIKFINEIKYCRKLSNI